MESNIQEALRAKAVAEHHFVAKDFIGAHSYALKAQMLCPEMEGLSQMVTTFGVYLASQAKINGEVDFYSILGMDPSAEKSKLKKQYKKMAVLLHPDKNKTVGADGAFRLVSEAWTLLSDSVKRSSYDQRRNSFIGYSTEGTGGYRSDTFWTVCTSCHIQYEYLKKYVNKRLSCKNCRGVFIAVETGLAPVNGAFPYCTYSYGPDNNGYGSHGCGGNTYIPTTTTGYRAPPNLGGHHHTGHRSSEFASNISFQGNSSVGVLDPNGLSTSSFVFYEENGDSKKNKEIREHKKTKCRRDHMGSNGCTAPPNGVVNPKRGRPAKKRKLELGSSFSNGEHIENSQNVVFVQGRKIINGNETTTLKPPAAASNKLSETSSIRRCSATPPFDARKMLIDKARSDILKKLKEMRLASEVAAAAEAEKRKVNAEIDKSSSEAAKVSETSRPPQIKRSVSMSITVPDSDFHDFDQDRSEECFKPKQIWALYDEEDGMPRLYCLIREVISVHPFKIFISYLNSKSDTEFGSVNWMDSGFTKSCGSFRVFHSETVEQVNIFSHLLSREKTGRGGCVRIYPRRGDIWAVYRNWSPDWNRATPDEVRHQYEMVEVLEDYSEENGVWVTPLIKLDGFKTVYQRNANHNTVRWIPKREMLRFSHQVPSAALNKVDDGTNLPAGCWDLDPAATPDELLQGEIELENNARRSPPIQMTLKTTEISHEEYPAAEVHKQSEKKLGQNETTSYGSIPEEQFQMVASKACTEVVSRVEIVRDHDRTPLMEVVRQGECRIIAEAADSVIMKQAASAHGAGVNWS